MWDYLCGTICRGLNVREQLLESGCSRVVARELLLQSDCSRLTAKLDQPVRDPEATVASSMSRNLPLGVFIEEEPLIFIGYSSMNNIQ